MPQKPLRQWVEGASVSVPFAGVSSLNLQCPQQLSNCCGVRENKSLTPGGEKLRVGRDEVVIEWALLPTRLWLIFVKHAFVQIVGLCAFVLFTLLLFHDGGHSS